MKILMMEPYVDLDKPYAESTHAKELAANFSYFGNHVILIARSCRDELEDLGGVEFRNVNLTRNPANARARINASISMIVGLFCAFVLGSIVLLRSEADVVYERYPFPFGLVLGKIFRVPVLTEVNGFLMDELNLGRIFRRIYSIYEGAMLRSTDRIVAVTSKLRDIICRTYKVPTEKISVIPNGVNTELFRHIDKKTARESLGLNVDRKIVGYIGKLEPWQGVEYLIRAAPSILQKFDGTMFLIVGDGLMYCELASMIEKLGLRNNFAFAGEIPHEDVPVYIGATDVCVTLKKGLKTGFSPLKLYEYMACERPVIASRVDGFEVLKEYGAGFLVSPEDSKEVSEAIIKLLSSPELQKCLGTNGREAVLEEFSWRTIAKRLITIFKGEIERLSTDRINRSRSPEGN